MKKSKQPKNIKKRIGFVLGGLGLFYLVVGFVLLPLAVWLIVPRVANKTIEGKVELGWVYANPLTFKVAIHDFKLLGSDDQELLEVGELTVNASLFKTLFTKEISASDFAIRKAKIQIDIQEDDSITLLSAVALVNPPEPTEESEPEANKEPMPLPLVAIRSIRIEDCELHFTDRRFANPFQRTIAPISLKLSHFRTHQESVNPYEFYLATDGNESLKIKGDIQFDPISFHGELALNEIKPGDYSDFYSTITNLEVRSAAIGFAANYHFEPIKTPIRLALESGKFTVDDLAVGVKGEVDPFFELDHFWVHGVNVDLIEKVASIDQIDIGDGHLDVELLPDGLPTFLDDLIVKTEAVESVSEETVVIQETVAAAPQELEIGITSGGEDLGVPINATMEIVETLAKETWSLALHEYKFSDFGVTISKVGSDGPGLKLQDISSTLSGFSNQPDTETTVVVHTRINEAGMFDVSGVISPFDRSLNLTVSQENLDLSELSAASPIALPIELRSGILTINSTISGGLDDAFALSFLEVDSSVKVSEMDVAIPEVSESLLQFDQLDIEHAFLSLPEPVVEVDKVTLQSSVVRLKRFADGSMSIDPLIPSPASEQTETAPVEEAEELAEAVVESPSEEEALPEQPAAPMPNVKVHQIVVSDAVFVFEDESFAPADPVALNLTDTQIQIDDIDLSSDTLMTFDLTTLMNTKGKIEVNAQLAAGDPMLNTTSVVKVQNLPLTAFSSFALPAVGKPISKGKLSADLTNDIKEGMLSSKTDIAITTLRFGEKDPAFDASKLPIGLGIAMLEGSDGVFTHSVSINDPVDDINVLEIVWSSFVDRILKIAVAPIGILTNLVSGGEVDLEKCEFESGSYDLNEANVKKLDLLAEGIQKRPTVKLVIIPSIDPVFDDVAIRTQMMNAELQGLHGGNRDGALRELYLRKFGELPESALASNELAPQEPAGEPSASSKTVDQPAKVAQNSYYLNAGDEEGNKVVFRKVVPAKVKPSVIATTNATEVEPEPLDRSEAMTGLSELEQKILDSYAVDPKLMVTLAEKRANSVKHYLMQEQKLSFEQVEVRLSDSFIPEEGSIVMFEIETLDE